MFTLRMDARVRSCYYELIRSFLLEEHVELSDLDSRRNTVEVAACKQKELRQLLEHHQKIQSERRPGESANIPYNGMGQTIPIVARVGNWPRKGSQPQSKRDQMEPSRLVEEHWDWTDFPGPLIGTAQYSLCTTCWMIYASIRTMFHDNLAKLIDQFSGPHLGIRGHCFLLGRLVFYANIDERSSILFSSFHLVWRSMLTFAGRNFRLTMVNFLLHSEADIDRFHRIMANDYEMARGSSRPPPDSARARLGNRKRRASGDGVSALEPPASLNERLLRHTMCYPVYYGTRIYFKLRPNRTREARLKLSDQVAKSFIFAMGLFLVPISVLAPYAILYIAADRRYLALFPGCYKMLDDMLARGELSFFSITPWNHHLLAGCVDGLENLFIWVDSFLAVTHGTIFCYLFNYDLLLYWSQLQAKLELLLERVRQRSPFYMWYLRPGCGSESAARAGPNEWADLGAGLGWLTTLAPTLDWRLENEIHELQFEVADFFHELERVDLIMSDVLTATILIWLSACSMLFYNFLIEHKSIPPIILTVLSAGFIVFAVVTHYLLLLRRCCLTSYRTLCSLMAHDVGEKRNLLKLMDFFIEMNGISYTLAHSYPYKPTTFLTIVGYTISCVLMIITLFSREDDTHELDTSTQSPTLAPMRPSNYFEEVLRGLGIS